MKISNDLYSIEITNSNYTLESTDNRRYDKVLNPFEFCRKDYCSSTLIIMDNSIDEHRCMLISEQNYANANGIIKGDTLWVKDFNDDEYTFNLSLCSHGEQNNVI